MRTLLLAGPLLALAALAWADVIGPGKDCPEIKADGWINGNAPKPEALKGKVLVVEFWAYW